ncbi:MAG: hypothetical protein NVS3B6_16980 [Pseudarthrobacter sp.]
MPALSPLWSPVRIGSTQLTSRGGLAPMTRVSATEDGHATEKMAAYYEAYARGGFSLLVTEGIYPDTAYSQGYPFQPGIATKEQTRSWTKVVDRVHAACARIFAQLMHAGAQTQGNRFVGSSIGPSAVAPKGEQLPFYRAHRQVRRIARKPGAVRGRDLPCRPRSRGPGHDRGHPDLTGQGQRPRPPLERRRRGSPSHLLHLGIDWNRLHPHHRVPRLRTCFRDGSPSPAALAKQYGGVPVIANGNLDDPEAAAALLRDGTADVVALGKAALANRNWPHRVHNGQPLDELNPGLFAPVADVKDWELELPA